MCDNHGEGDKEFEYWPKHALAGTDGARLDGRVLGDFHFWNSLAEPNKPTGWYTCKKTYSGFLNTDLDAILKDRKTRKVYIAGILTDVCVLVTAIESQMRGYETFIYRKCVAALTQEKNDRALEQLEGIFKVKVI